MKLSEVLYKQIKIAFQMKSMNELLDLLGQVKMAFHLKGINEEEFNKLYNECTRALYFCKS